MKPCKICRRQTKAIFNIQFKQVPICEYCAGNIAMQQVIWLVGRRMVENYEQSKAKKKPYQPFAKKNQALPFKKKK